MEKESKIEVKKFKYHIIIDFRTGAMRSVKKKPASIKPYEIGTELNIKVNIPLKQEIKFDAEITLPETKVVDITSELI